MPAKNSHKSYVDDGYYHVFNRGVEKRKIFQDKQDYAIFLSYLKEYLTPKDKDFLLQMLSNPTTSSKEKDKILKALRMNNFASEITLISYCLMPNHFHLLIHQKSSTDMDTFMNSLCTRYTMYFNKKYKRVGTLYQGVYKAVLISTEEQLLHLTRYIHRNPIKLASQGLPLQTQQPSSYLEYLQRRKTPWIHPELVLSYFSKVNSHFSYEAFVAQTENPEVIQELLLDENA